MPAKRMPSIGVLSALFDDPKEARRILKMSRAELCATEAGSARVRECYTPPETYDIRLCVLNAIDAGLHGVDAIKLGDEFADYLNAGEMYAVTLIHWRGRYRVQSLGDFVEIMERRGLRAL